MEITSLETNLPLVSIVVVTYNSSCFVLETLESIYNQTYENIELIITDDCSEDDTVQKCKFWIETHHKRFVSVNLLTSSYNTGVSANANRGYSSTKGLWIKGIAGDDILLPKCIELYMNHIRKYPQIELCTSKAQCFSLSKTGEKEYRDIIPTIQHQRIFNLSALEQMKILLDQNIIPTPTMIIKKDVYFKYPYNNIYRYMEDLPFLIKVTSNNIKLDFLDETTILYRLSDKSISHANNMLYPSKMYESKTIYYLNEKKDLINKNTPFLKKREEKDILLWWISEVCFQNKKTFFSRIVLRILKKII